jgi:hypothetical protein
MECSFYDATAVFRNNDPIGHLYNRGCHHLGTSQTDFIFHMYYYVDHGVSVSGMMKERGYCAVTSNVALVLFSPGTAISTRTCQGPLIVNCTCT